MIAEIRNARIEAAKPRPIAAKQEGRSSNPHKVEWAFLMWGQFTDDHKRKLREHIATMDQDAADRYRKYLEQTVGMPAGAV